MAEEKLGVYLLEALIGQGGMGQVYRAFDTRKKRHVIPIHDFGEIDGRLFPDMRLVEGTSLARLLSGQGPLPPIRAVKIVIQVGKRWGNSPEVSKTDRSPSLPETLRDEPPFTETFFKIPNPFGPHCFTGRRRQ